VIASVLTIDSLRNKAKWEAELVQQRAIEAALKNQERALDLRKKIKNPDLRDEFIRKMANAIAPLVGSDGLRLKKIGC
jgi:hypothetical protein